MSEERTIADSILLGNTIDQSLEEAQREVDKLPFNHPSRLSHYLDQEIVNESSGFGVNHDVVKAVGLARELEVERSGLRQSRSEANRMVQDDYKAALRREIANSGSW